MLVLTRKVGDGILIGDDIVIKIFEMKGGGVRIVIDAPQDKKIYRQEVYDRITEENKEALQWNLTDLDALSENFIVEKKKK
jgi:carbon storage regulator